MPLVSCPIWRNSKGFVPLDRVTNGGVAPKPAPGLALLVTGGHSDCAAVDDRAYVDLLQRALPRLGLRFRGFKNVRRQVCRRIAARIAALGLDSPRAYERVLERDPEELRVLDSICFVTISRFYRDRRIWDALRGALLPRVLDEAEARGERLVRAWSLGCASGEEPYTLAILWEIELASRWPALDLEIVATERDDEVLARAAQGIYEPSSVREVPLEWRAKAFEPIDGATSMRVRSELRRRVRFERADGRSEAAMPPAPIHLVMCRNMAFTYWAETEQRALCARILEHLGPGGLLVLGNHEELPGDPVTLGFLPVSEAPHVFRAARELTSSSRS